MKKKIFLIGLFIAVVAVVSLVIVFQVKKNHEQYITIGLASKMLAMLEADEGFISDSPQCFEDGQDEWFEKYMNYMYYHGYLDKSSNAPTDKTGRKYWTYKHLNTYLSKKGLSLDTDTAGTWVKNLSSDKKMKKTDFLELYEYFVVMYGSEEGVHTEELIISGTPSNTVEAARWKTYTSNGVYGFEGLVLDQYIDKSIMVYVRNKEIISVIMKLSDRVVYKNIWLEKGENTTVTASIGGGKRTFEVETLQAGFEQTIGDIYIEDGKVVSITLKKEKIDGKVLMVNDSQVEIENYGVLNLDENFHVYRTYGSVKEGSISEILVGYDLADFVVADGKVCAAIISRTLTADNIRVLIMSTGYTSLLHDRVSFTGTSDYTVKYGDKTEEHKAGEIIDLYPDCEQLMDGRVTINSSDPEGKIKILTVERSYGNPSYRGTIEVARSDDRLALINDVLIEEYLYAVVPSEMPNRFGVEALKVQAVCARSYAYRQLLNNSYSKYGAHVDDSVNFQVYNNVEEKENATRAVQETYGEVAVYEGNPITTYYYSTSCGHTSDNTIWGGNPASCPYLVSKTVNKQGENTDLSSEEAFSEFIHTVNEEDFDYGFGYYRWNIRMSLSEITNSVNEYIYSRYCANPGSIKTLENGCFVSKEIRNVGDVTGIEVESRSSGGALMSIIIYGTKETVRVENELNIRYVLCPRDNPIALLKGDTTTFYILPSAYCMFEKYEENGEIGYVITGGGYGHGIGMSQNAVSSMVAAGMKYDEILEFFYEGTTLKNVYLND